MCLKTNISWRFDKYFQQACKCVVVVTGSDEFQWKERGSSLQVNLGSYVWKPTHMVWVLLILWIIHHSRNRWDLEWLKHMKTWSKISEAERLKKWEQSKVSHKVQCKAFVQVKIQIRDLVFSTLLWISDCTNSCSICRNTMEENFQWETIREWSSLLRGR